MSSRPIDPWPSDAFASALLTWYDQHGRKDLPWQQDPTPYRVWVSEVMLQQTQVGVVIPYFERFMCAFPSLVNLADAPVDVVLALWSGLGYYARARHLHQAARLIRDQHGGVFPTQFEQARALPGVGRSTAGAILSLALGQRHPILDGNVKRVLARCFAVEGWPGQGAIQSRLWELAERCTPSSRVGAYNQGMMDLGATLCTRTSPGCERCPVAAQCLARLQGRQGALPASRPRKTIPERNTLMFLVINPAGEILLERRPASGIWGGLWSLPEALPETAVDDWCLTRFGIAPARVEMQSPRRHTFSHFSLVMRVAEIHLDRPVNAVTDTLDQCWLSPVDLPQVGLPAPVRTILDALEQSNLKLTI